jgi:CheY-like chemotaxis protein
VAPSVLLIEDDGRLAGTVAEYLREAGFRVAVAAEGRAGLERLTREPYDALMLDLMLPDMDGLEGCRQLRAKLQTDQLLGEDAESVMRGPLPLAVESKAFRYGQLEYRSNDLRSQVPAWLVRPTHPEGRGRS